MNPRVCKFGGSSLADADGFRRVRRIIAADSSRKYIVVSAPGRSATNDEKVTDLLLRAFRAGENARHAILTHVFERYASIRAALNIDCDLEAEFDKIERTNAPSPAALISRGEYLCAQLFAAYCGMEFVDARDLIIFGLDGSVDVRATSAAVTMLKTTSTAVIPGFYGAGPDGEIALFSRGGSDVSGALIAAAFAPCIYENWTDVDGLYSADPQLVPNARLHPRVGFAQMTALSACGAQVLHPDSLICLRGRGVAVELRNSFNPACAGTRISEAFDHSIVPCAALRRGLCLPANALDPALQAEYATNVSVTIPVAAISVFGLLPERLPQLMQAINPISCIHRTDHIELHVHENACDDALRTVHQILTA